MADLCASAQPRQSRHVVKCAAKSCASWLQASSGAANETFESQPLRCVPNGPIVVRHPPGSLILDLASRQSHLCNTLSHDGRRHFCIHIQDLSGFQRTSKLVACGCSDFGIIINPVTGGSSIGSHTLSTGAIVGIIVAVVVMLLCASALFGER
jgi:hypothetical protein